MAMRSSVVRMVAVFLILCIGWYTVHIYIDLFGRLTSPSPIKLDIKKESEIKLEISEFDQKEMEEANAEWKKQQNLFQPIVKKLNRNPCFSSSSCTDNEFNFKLISGAANAIGPSICFNGTIVMKNSLNNVDRGMNIAVFNGKTGEAVRQLVFDLFDKDSTELKQFLKNLNPDDIILVASADDAGHKLDDEAKDLLAGIGSTLSKDLSFRDNWVFVGGQRMKKPSPFEKFIKSDKNNNKYGEWPEAISLEGCIPKLT